MSIYRKMLKRRFRKWLEMPPIVSPEPLRYKYVWLHPRRRQNQFRDKNYCFRVECTSVKNSIRAYSLLIGRRVKSWYNKNVCYICIQIRVFPCMVLIRFFVNNRKLFIQIRIHYIVCTRILFHIYYINIGPAVRRPERHLIILNGELSCASQSFIRMPNNIIRTRILFKPHVMFFFFKKFFTILYFAIFTRRRTSNTDVDVLKMSSKILQYYCVLHYR